MANNIEQLTVRYRDLLSKSAVTEANYQRSVEELKAAEAKITDLGFSSVEEAQQFLSTLKTQIEARTQELDALLTRLGV